jgi:hypothetical protein
VADPCLGGAAPYVSKFTATTEKGLTYTFDETATPRAKTTVACTTNAQCPGSTCDSTSHHCTCNANMALVVSQSDSWSVNAVGPYSRVVSNPAGSNGTMTFTTPGGRTLTQTLDLSGRVIQAAIPNGSGSHGTHAFVVT